MRRRKDARAGLVLGREHDAVLEVLDERVDVVDLVRLGAREVKDDYGLQLVVEGDVGHLAVGENRSLVDGHKVSGEPGLASVSLVVVVPEELAWVWRVWRVHE